MLASLGCQITRRAMCVMKSMAWSLRAFGTIKQPKRCVASSVADSPTGNSVVSGTVKNETAAGAFPCASTNAHRGREPHGTQFGWWLVNIGNICGANWYAIRSVSKYQHSWPRSRIHSHQPIRGRR